MKTNYLQHGSLNQICGFYREQLRKFEKIGLGNKTENDVVVTEKLIAITKKRLYELTFSRSLSRKGLVLTGVQGEA